MRCWKSREVRANRNEIDDRKWKWKWKWKWNWKWTNRFCGDELPEGYEECERTSNKDVYVLCFYFAMTTLTTVICLRTLIHYNFTTDIVSSLMTVVPQDSAGITNRQQYLITATTAAQHLVLVLRITDTCNAPHLTLVLLLAHCCSLYRLATATSAAKTMPNAFTSPFFRCLACNCRKLSNAALWRDWNHGCASRVCGGRADRHMRTCALVRKLARGHTCTHVQPRLRMIACAALCICACTNCIPNARFSEQWCLQRSWTSSPWSSTTSPVSSRSAST